MESEFYNNGTDIIVIISAICAFLLMCTRVLYKSKCKTVNLCYGLINIDRTVEIETDIIDVIPRQNTINVIV